MKQYENKCFCFCLRVLPDYVIFMFVLILIKHLKILSQSCLTVSAPYRLFCSNTQEMTSAQSVRAQGLRL